MTPVVMMTAVIAGLVVIFLWRARLHRQQLLASVEIVTLQGVTSAALANSRDIYIYLPPGYRRRQNQNTRYTVLYLNDGQERETLSLRETLARLTISGKIRPIIAVAIPTNEDRLHEYGTAGRPSARGLGSKAGAYSSFVIDELIPIIDREFRTRSPAIFAGVSLGGLSAFDIVWNYPAVFNTVGVMSGSFWWHDADGDDWGDSDPRIAHAMVRASTYRPGFRGWFQAGTRDEVNDRDQNGIIDAIQDTQELIDELVALGYRRDIDLKYIEVTGGRHDYETWAKVLPEFLIWALSPGSPRPEGRSSTGLLLPR